MQSQGEFVAFLMGCLIPQPIQENHQKIIRKSSENHQKSKKHRQVFLGITEDED